MAVGGPVLGKDLLKARIAEIKAGRLKVTSLSAVVPPFALLELSMLPASGRAKRPESVVVQVAAKGHRSGSMAGNSAGTSAVRPSSHPGSEAL